MSADVNFKRIDRARVSGAFCAPVRFIVRRVKSSTSPQKDYDKGVKSVAAVLMRAIYCKPNGQVKNLWRVVEKLFQHDK